MINPIQLQKYLGGVDYPVNKQDLIAKAKENSAPDDILETLNKLPDESFETPADVNKAIGEMNEG